MSPKDALEGLVAFLHDSLSLSLAFGVTNGDAVVLRRAGLSDEVARQILEHAISWIRLLRDSELVPYEVGYTPVGTEVIFVETASNPNHETLLNSLNPITSVPLFAEEEGFLESVSITALGLVDKSGRQATLLRHVTRSFVLSRSSKKVRLFFNKGVFDEIREEVIQIDSTYDCVSWNDYIFIGSKSSKDRFEELFDYGHLKIAHTQATLCQMAQNLPLADPALFVDTLTKDRRYQKKVASAFSRGIFRDAPLERIKHVIASRNLPLELTMDEHGQYVLVFDPSPAGRRALLALLDDDHVESELTDRKYEATSKLELKVSP